MPIFNTYPTIDTPNADDLLLIWNNGAVKTIKKSDLAEVSLSSLGSIADLKAFDVNTVEDGAQLFVSGYFSIGDGGGGHFYYDADSVETADDGMIIAPDAGPGRWLRLIEYGGRINTKMFGARGDGVANDAAALQAALDAIATAGTVGSPPYANAVPTLVFDPGQYNIATGLVVVGQNWKIEGNKAVIKATAGFSKMLTVGNNTSLPEGIEIESLRLNCNSQASYGVYIREAAFMSLEDVHAVNAGTACMCVDGGDNRGNYGILFNNCLVGGTTVGFQFLKNGNTTAFTDFTLLSCHAEGGTKLIENNGNAVINIIGGYFQNATQYVLYADGGTINNYGGHFEAGNVGANDVYLTTGAIMIPFGANYNVVVFGDATSAVRMSVVGEILAGTSGATLGSVVAGNGWYSNAEKWRLVRLGNARTLNYDDGMVSQNLAPVYAADTYQTFADGSYAAVVFYYDGSGRKGVRFITSPSAGTAGVPFTPAYPLAVDGDGMVSLTKHLEMVEQGSSPAAPAANGVRIYAKDNGSGKTVLYARFASGTEQQIAIEP